MLPLPPVGDRVGYFPLEDVDLSDPGDRAIDTSNVSFRQFGFWDAGKLRDFYAYGYVFSRDTAYVNIFSRFIEITSRFV